MTPKEKRAEIEILNIRDLKVDFKKSSGFVNVVSGIDLGIKHSRIAGIAGESGSGKTVSLLALTKLLPASLCRVGYQSYRLSGNAVRPKQISFLRGRFLSYIFQDAVSSLDPMFTVRFHLKESLSAAGKKSPEEGLLLNLLQAVGLKDAGRVLDSYPHQLSGGMAQRVAIALSIAAEPKILVADEPTTALDADLRMGILNLLKKLRDEKGLSIFFISHDLEQIFYTADTVYIFYAGRIVEKASAAQMKKLPLHPYTIALMGCLPRPGIGRLEQIHGKCPDYSDLPCGCKFHPRCSRVSDICRGKEPQLKEVKKGHWAACYNLKL